MTALAILLSIVLQQPPRDTRAVTAGASGRITGIVTTDDAQPRPLRRTRVTLNGGSAPRMVITGDDGRFVFDRLAPGRFTVDAAKDGYVAMSYGATRTGRRGSGIQIADGQSVSLSLRLARGAVITGTVIDVDGQPAAGITVSALTRRYIGGPVEYRYSPNGMPTPAVTDDRGIFRIFALPAGDYLIAAQPQSRQPFPGGGEVRMLSGGVVSDRGRILTQVFHSGTTDAGNAARVSVRAGEERSGIDIPLQYVPLATISGTAPSAAGWTPALVALARTDEGAGYETGRNTRADASGAFSFSGIPPGQYRVVAVSRQASAVPAPGSSRVVAPGDALTASADIVVSGEDVLGLGLAMQPALTISGKISFEGERPPPPLVDLSVNVPFSLTVADSGYPFPRAQIRPDGTFRAEGIVPGLYRGVAAAQGLRTPIGNWWLKSVVAGGRDLLDAPLDLRRSIDDAVITLTDRASEIAGTVRDARGVAAPEPYVIAFATDRSTWFANSRRIAAVRPDREGRYAIRNLPPGEYRLAAADLDQNEWFDPAVLERLVTAATPIRIVGVDRQAIDLVVK